MTTPALGYLVHSFFVDYLQVQKGLRLASVRSYRDVLRLFLGFVGREARRPITRLSLQDLNYGRVQQFLLRWDRCRGHARPPSRFAARSIRCASR